MHALFADGEVAWTALGAAVAGVIYALSKGYVWVKHARDENSDKVRQWSEQQRQGIVTRLDLEIADLRQRMTNAETRAANAEREHQMCLRVNSRMEAWFRYSAEPLRRAGIPVPSFEDDPDHDPGVTP